MSLANEAIMRKLCSLYAMYWMVQNSGGFMTVSCFAVCSTAPFCAFFGIVGKLSVYCTGQQQYHCIV